MATRMRASSKSMDAVMPSFPRRNKRRHYPALETIAISIARTIIAERVDLGLTRAQLAKLAGVRLTSVELVESATGGLNGSVVDKLDAALKRASIARRASRRGGRKRS